jgi:BirA family biotin operon repressor/biotin-[acetyl-CoA-carboxylase] ligase
LPQAAIKWPNDVLIADRKVAGILVETSHDSSGHLIAILGIGVNVLTLSIHAIDDANNGIDTASSLLERATTLETAYGHAVSREAFIARLVEHLEAFYLMLQQDTAYRADLVDQIMHQEDVPHTVSRTISAARLLRERWRERLTTLGRTVQVRQGNTLLEGIAEDVDESGELLLRLHSGERVTITWGDIGYPTQNSTNAPTM